MVASNPAYIENIEEDNVDQSVWVPHGEDVVPSILIKRRYASAIGKRFFTNEWTIVDHLLRSGKIEDCHHYIATKLANLCRIALSKQDYAVTHVFSGPRGQSNSDYCPMTEFLHVTRGLRRDQWSWVQTICGLRHITYQEIEQNVDKLREALEAVEGLWMAEDSARREPSQTVGGCTK